jgi:hypothetical protein
MSQRIFVFQQKNHRSTGKTSDVSLKADSMFQLIRAGCEGADMVFARFGTGLADETVRPLAAHPEAFYLNYMKQIIDIEESSRLPWRFFGAAKSVLGRL